MEHADHGTRDDGGAELTHEKAVVLRAAGCSINDIAKALGVSRRAAKQHVRRHASDIPVLRGDFREQLRLYVLHNIDDLVDDYIDGEHEPVMLFEFATSTDLDLTPTASIPVYVDEMSEAEREELADMKRRLLGI